MAWVRLRQYFIVEEERRKNLKVKFDLKPAGKPKIVIGTKAKKPKPSAIFNQQDDDEEETEVSNSAEGFKPRTGIMILCWFVDRL